MTSEHSANQATPNNHPAPNLRALIRDGAPVPADEADLGPADKADLGPWYHCQRATVADRPYAILGMIASIDGATTMDGLSGGLGNITDRRVLGAVRRAGPVVIVGATTARDESYSPTTFAGQRVGVVTRGSDPKANADLCTSELFAAGVGFLITTDSAVVPDGVDCVRAGTDSVDMAVALAGLSAVVGQVATVVIEGGPTLNGAAVAAGIIDEVCVTTSPKLVDGTSERIVFGGPATDQRFGLAHLLLDGDGYLFARWVRAAS